MLQSRPIPFDSVAIAKLQRDVLHDLFGGRAWFQNPRNQGHYAAQRWRLLDEHIRTGGRTVPSLDDTDGLWVLAETELDGYHLLGAMGGSLPELRLGALANYGDSRVQNRIRTAIRNPANFFPIMTELARAAFHVQIGHQVIARETENAGDLRVSVPDLDLPLIVECKRIRFDANANRYSALVCDANRQIRSENVPCYGVLVIDVTEKARLYIKRFRSNGIRRIHTPSAVVEARSAMRRLLVCQSTSVSCAVIVWNEISLRPDAGPLCQGSCRLSS